MPVSFQRAANCPAGPNGDGSIPETSPCAAIAFTPPVTRDVTFCSPSPIVSVTPSESVMSNRTGGMGYGGPISTAVGTSNDRNVASRRITRMPRRS